MNELSNTDPVRRAHIETLLRHYPQIEAAETAEVLDFLKSGPIIDIGMLSGDPEIKAIVERVRADHARHFRVSIRQWLILTAVLVVPTLLFAWMAWDWGSK